MKILSVHFKNINSLAGEWSLDFTDSSYRDGIFLLTGPVGSGKTTIFDAITLALFGRTDRVTVSTTECPVMTQGTGECFSEVVFETSGRRYRSRWGQKRANESAKGNLQSSTHILLDADTGRELFPRCPPSKTRFKIQELLGITFPQFTRTTLLAQGKFNEFLKTDEKGRSEILEQVTRTTRFSDAGRRISEIHSQKVSAVKNLNLRVGDVSLMPDDVRAKREAELETLAQELKDVQTKSDALGREAFWVREGTELARKRERLTVDEKALQERLATFAEESARLDAAEKAHALKADAAMLKAALDKAALAQKEVVARRATRDTLREETRTVERMVAAADEELKSAAEKQTADLARAANALTAKTKLDQCSAGWKQARERQAEAQVRLNAEEENLEAKRAAEIRAKELVECLSSSPENRRISEVLAGRPAIRNLLELENLRTNILPMRQALEAARSESEAAERSMVAAENAFNQRRSQLEQAVDIAEKNKEFADRSQSLEIHRARLHDGDVCPLCGNVYHAKDLSPLFDGVEKALRVAREALKKEESLVDAARKARDKARRKVEELDKSFVSDEKRLGSLEAQCKADLASAESTVQSAAENVKEAQRRLAAAKQERQETATAEGSAHADFNAAKKAFEDFGIPDPEAYADEVRSVYSKVENEAREVRENLNRLTDALRNAEAECQTAETTCQSADEEARNTERAFGEKLVASGFADKQTWEDSCWDGEEFESARNERDGLRKERIALDNRRETLAGDSAAHEASADATIRSEDEVLAEKATVDARRDEINRDLGSIRAELKTDDGNRQRLGSLQEDLAAAQEEANRWGVLDDFLGGDNGYRFRNYANGFTLRHLLARANPHLQQMSGGRYSMKWDAPKPDEKKSGQKQARVNSNPYGLHPEIIDAEAGSVNRTVRNLSGGEIFQVSLALALGLSEMARGSERMENLFLDEGFGTLEGEPLERAIDTLEHVQGSGCLLGVISHVSAVADRIRTQIVAEKDGFGHSSLNGPGVTRPASAPAETGKTKSKTRKKKKDPETNEKPDL